MESLFDNTHPSFPLFFNLSLCCFFSITEGDFPAHWLQQYVVNILEGLPIKLTGLPHVGHNGFSST
nr:MAG TPA: hypothetical protein [Caudoviricetes sp.]